MRLWSFHPYYLDDTGLRRLWNESLIAARALVAIERGEKRGYQDHPQLLRFKNSPEPIQAISDYMHVIADEALRRGLRYPKAFRRRYIPMAGNGTHMSVSAGQMEFEVWHYGAILVRRRGNGPAYVDFWSIPEHQPHPIFTVVRGAVEEWEKLPPHDYTTCVQCNDPIYHNGKGQPPKKCTHCRPKRS